MSDSLASTPSSSGDFSRTSTVFDTGDLAQQLQLVSPAQTKEDADFQCGVKVDNFHTATEHSRSHSHCHEPALVANEYPVLQSKSGSRSGTASGSVSISDAGSDSASLPGSANGSTLFPAVAVTATPSVSYATNNPPSRLAAERRRKQNRVSARRSRVKRKVEMSAVMELVGEHTKLIAALEEKVATLSMKVTEAKRHAAALASEQSDFDKDDSQGDDLKHQTQHPTLESDPESDHESEVAEVDNQNLRQNLQDCNKASQMRQNGTAHREHPYITSEEEVDARAMPAQMYQHRSPKLKHYGQQRQLLHTHEGSRQKSQSFNLPFHQKSLQQVGAEFQSHHQLNGGSIQQVYVSHPGDHWLKPDKIRPGVHQQTKPFNQVSSTQSSPTSQDSVQDIAQLFRQNNVRRPDSFVNIELLAQPNQPANYSNNLSLNELGELQTQHADTIDSLHGPISQNSDQNAIQLSGPLFQLKTEHMTGLMDAEQSSAEVAAVQEPPITQQNSQTSYPRPMAHSCEHNEPCTCCGRDKDGELINVSFLRPDSGIQTLRSTAISREPHRDITKHIIPDDYYKLTEFSNSDHADHSPHLADGQSLATLNSLSSAPRGVIPAASWSSSILEQSAPAGTGSCEPNALHLQTNTGHPSLARQLTYDESSQNMPGSHLMTQNYSALIDAEAVATACGRNNLSEENLRARSQTGAYVESMNVHSQNSAGMSLFDDFANMMQIDNPQNILTPFSPMVGCGPIGSPSGTGSLSQLFPHDLIIGVPDSSNSVVPECSPHGIISQIHEQMQGDVRDFSQNLMVENEARSTAPFPVAAHLDSLVLNRASLARSFVAETGVGTASLQAERSKLSALPTSPAIVVDSGAGLGDPPFAAPESYVSGAYPTASADYEHGVTWSSFELSPNAFSG